MPNPDRLLTGDEVAELFRVDRKTVTRWAKSGLLRSVRTPGGHYRFVESDVAKILAESAQERPPLQ